MKYKLFLSHNKIIREIVIFGDNKTKKKFF